MEFISENRQESVTVNRTEDPRTSELLLKDLASKQQKLRLILAPPRSGSTLFCSIVSRSNDVSAAVHEPSNNAHKRGDADEALQVIREQLPDTDGSTIVVKEMAHWAFEAGVFRELVAIAASPVLFLTRDPHLTIESRMTKVLEAAYLKLKPDLSDAMASLGYGEFDGSLDSQRTIMNHYAHDAGFCDWNEMIQYAKEHRDYSGQFGRAIQIIKEIGLLPNHSSGWKAMKDQCDLLIRERVNFKVLDTADLCEAPETYVPKICELWNLSYTPNMVQWSECGLNGYQTRQANPHETIWYDTLQRSRRIYKPMSALHKDRFPLNLLPSIEADEEHYTHIAGQPQRLLDQGLILQPGFLDRMDSLQPTYGRVLRKFLDQDSVLSPDARKLRQHVDGPK